MLGKLRARLPAGWLVLGCVLPDLIDKPLFYGLLWLSHRTPIHLVIVRGSRSFGHTLLFPLLLLGAAAAARSRAAWAVFAGVATHVLLDIGGELISGSNPESSKRHRCRRSCG